MHNIDGESIVDPKGSEASYDPLGNVEGTSGDNPILDCSCVD